MSKLCQAPGCTNPVDPSDPSAKVTQKFCSNRCGVRTRVARYRAKHRRSSPPPDGGGDVYGTMAGVVEYEPGADKMGRIGYSVKSGKKKRPQSVPAQEPLFPASFTSKNPTAGGLGNVAA